MLITYVDESERGRQIYFIGALTVDTAAAVAIEESLDGIVMEASGAWPALSPEAELHGRDVFQGEADWAGVPPRLRANVCVQAIEAIAASGARFVIRGTDRPALLRKYPEPHPIHELTLSHALGRVNGLLLDRESALERTLVIADEHHAAEDSRRRFKQIRRLSGDGYSQEPLTQLIDTVYFGPSHHSRLLQASDMATFFSNRILTMQESDPRSASTMSTIDSLLLRFTDQRYIWVPKAETPG
ncbi:DUF3800 domain-containing protein [Arenivirga flava]|uniref:DUF3800 domain-containing protein n=1 Tax=Arenivirga flava TaxID=1930060 RepID=A0AA37ULZ4_9MICO|nr:DUF3800 domain-containing protein [Arenivirga flava]GMA29231.1 hypothetical protein GCM10025874_24840 [Arenivirga flava]